MRRKFFEWLRRKLRVPDQSWEPYGEIVSACAFRDRLLIFTKRGDIYTLDIDQNGQPFLSKLLIRIPLL